jgi:hypothetical protein
MAVLAGAATVFSIVAVKWARKAVHTNEAQVRAYFRVTNIRFDWEPNQLIPGFQVIVSWENCGESPALGCVFMGDFVVEQINESERFVPKFANWNLDSVQPRTAPIGQTLHSPICAISGIEAERLGAHKTKLIIYAAVRYTDVFETTFVEEVCNVAVFPEDVGGSIRFRAYPHHNEYREK